MNVVKIQDKEYRCICDWSEMTLSQAQKVYEIPMPEKLKDFYLKIIKGDKDLKFDFTIEEYEKDLPLYYGKVICALSDIPESIMEYVDKLQREELYRYTSKNNISMLLIVLSLLGEPLNFVPTNLKSFKWNGETLMFPESKIALGIEKPFANETAKTFCESADLLINCEKLKQGKYQSMANIIAILCRPAGEKYNEETSLKRALMFDNLTMDIVWQVFFYLIPSYNSLQKILETYLKELESELKKPV